MASPGGAEKLSEDLARHTRRQPTPRWRWRRGRRALSGTARDRYDEQAAVRVHRCRTTHRRDAVAGGASARSLRRCRPREPQALYSHSFCTAPLAASDSHARPLTLPNHVVVALAGIELQREAARCRRGRVHRPWSATQDRQSVQPCVATHRPCDLSLLHLDYSGRYGGNL